MDLETVDHQQDKIKKEFQTNTHIHLETVLSNWMNQQQIQDKKKTDENGTEFVRNILVALLNQGKQEKIAQFI